jgi:hypothetical protein
MKDPLVQACRVSANGIVAIYAVQPFILRGYGIGSF